MKISPNEDYYRCDDENCDYDVCPRCGTVAGIEMVDDSSSAPDASRSFS